MTIPDIGHCAGSGAPPLEGTARATARNARSGVCAACSGRFELHDDGNLTLHASAEIEQRERIGTESE